MGIDFSNLFTRPAVQHGSAKEQLGNLAGMLQRSGGGPAPAPEAAGATEAVETMSDLIRASDDVAVDAAQQAGRSGGIRSMGFDDLRNLLSRGGGGAAEASSAGAAAIGDDAAKAVAAGVLDSGGVAATRSFRSMGIEDIGALFNRGGAGSAAGAGAAAAAAPAAAAAAASPAASLADDAIVTAASLADDAAATVAKSGVMDDLLKAAGMLSKINPRG